MKRWSRPISGRKRSPVDDAARARTIRAVMAEATALRAADAAEERRFEKQIQDVRYIDADTKSRTR
jgi:hypothetical protein